MIHFDFREAAVEYKEVYISLTLSSKEEDYMFIVDNILKYGCSALNARCDMTLYMGVADDRTIIGVFIEDLGVVSKSSV